MKTDFHADFAAMIADGTYGRATRFEKNKARKQDRTALRRNTRDAVDAHFAGDL